MVHINTGKKAAPKAAPEAVAKPAEVTEADRANADAFANTAPQVDPKDLENFMRDSDALEYVGELVHPTQKDHRTRKGENGQDVTIEGRKVVGYKFKVLKDITLPDFGPLQNHNIYSGTNFNGTRDYKAGEDAYLTMLEIGALAATPEFGRRITGGEGKDIKVSFRQPRQTDKNGNVRVNDDLPHPTVTFISKNAGILRSAEYEIPVGIESGLSENGRPRAAAYPEGEHPEFDKWRSLFSSSKQTVRKHTKAKADPRNEFFEDKAAMRFREALRKKAEKQA